MRGFVSGSVGERAQNAIPTEARLSLDFRLVPDQTPLRVQERLEAFLASLGYTVVRETPDAELRRQKRVVKVTWDAGEQRVRVSAPDVQGIFVWWQGDDLTRIRRLASRYRIDADEAVSSGLLASGGGQSAIRNPKSAIEITEVWTPQRFELWAGNDRIDARPKPYGFIPFVVYPYSRNQSVLAVRTNTSPRWTGWDG